MGVGVGDGLPAGGDGAHHLPRIVVGVGDGFSGVGCAAGGLYFGEHAAVFIVGAGGVARAIGKFMLLFPEAESVLRCLVQFPARR